MFSGKVLESSTIKLVISGCCGLVTQSNTGSRPNRLKNNCVLYIH